MQRQHGEPPCKKNAHYSRGCMPLTNEGVDFDDTGICNAYRSSKEKMRID